MSRVDELRDDQLDEATRQVFRSFEDEGRDPIALYRVLANAPSFLGGIHEIGAAIRYRSELERSLLELVILRIAHLTGSTYEWNHHHRMARAAGLSREQLAGVQSWREHRALYSPAELAALEISDQVHELAVTDAAFATLREHFTVRQASEIVILAAHYESVARVLQGLSVELEPEYRSLD